MVKGLHFDKDRIYLNINLSRGVGVS